MERKIKISFIYRNCSILTEQNYYTQSYNFFFKALSRNNSIEVDYVVADKIFDANKLNGKTDAILLFDTFNSGQSCVPDQITGMRNLTIPVFVRVGNPWTAKKYDVQENHDKYKVDAYFGPWAKEFFNKYYSSNFKFNPILYGIEPSLYQNITPFNKRIKNRILNSGAIANSGIINRLFQKLIRGDDDPMKHYKLRTSCNKLPYVDYTSTMNHEYVGNKYPLQLNKYATAIAATTDTFTMKYFEMPAAACMTFMEITEKNYAKTLGYKDGETAIFIDEKNYQEKFEQYLNDIENPKWEEIAYAGRKFALDNFTNDKGVESLIQLIKEFV